MAPKVLVVLSEKGGITKTTVAALLGMAAARDGREVTMMDLDPRATLTGLLRAEEFAPGYSADAILAADAPDGWAAELRVRSGWLEDGLYVVPAGRSLGNREKAPADHGEHRLARSLRSLSGDLVIVDTPPRPGGVLVLSGLAIPGAHVVYASTADQDGLDGIAQSWRTVSAAREYTNKDLHTLGITVSRVDRRRVDDRRCLAELEDIYGTLLLEPYLPERAIVRQARAAEDWLGYYRDGSEVAELSDELWRNVHARMI